VAWNPAEDFNALGFLYFARFSRLLSAARWHAGVRSCQRPPLPRRQLTALLGNLNEQDTLSASVFNREGAGSRTIVLRRGSDHSVIAIAEES
jgi:probable biosynthetic protein (TIGR04098 family)